MYFMAFLKLVDGKFEIVTMDEFVDSLLMEERVCETTFPRLTLRSVLEQNELLAPREFLLDEEELSGSDVQSDHEDDENADTKRAGKLKFKSKKSEEVEERHEQKKESGDNFRESMSIEETNRIRISLGLKPLQ